MAETLLARRLFLPLLLASALPACGFTPIYASAGPGDGPAQEGLAAISVGLLPERSGQLLRQALQARFALGGSGVARRYDLTVAYGLSGEAIGYQQDSTITRVRLVASAIWTLTAQDPQRTTLSTGTARTLDGYNIINQQFFAADMENDATQRRLAIAMADQIAIQLAVYFKRRSTAA